MPEKLREALRDASLRSASYGDASRNEPPRLVSSMDPHSVERAMFDDIMKDCDRAIPRAPPPKDLMAQMAERLRGLESSTAILSKQNKDQATKIKELQDELGGDVDEENRCLRSRVVQMEAFLADYGLVWVGNDEAAAASKDDDEVDSAELVSRLTALTRKAEAEGGLLKIVREGQKAQFVSKPPCTVHVYADGIYLKNGPFRSYATSETARAFARDVFDGYYPLELKTDWPEGVTFEVVDKHDTTYSVFQGEGHTAGRKPRTLADMGGSEVSMVDPETFLSRLPAAVISKTGNILDVREGIRQRLQPEEAAVVADEEDAAGLDYCDPAEVTALQIRDGPKKVLVRIAKTATVGQLRREIAKKCTGGEDNFEIRTAHPNRAYNDRQATLQAEGLFPSATLFLQRQPLSCVVILKRQQSDEQ